MIGLKPSSIGAALMVCILAAPTDGRADIPAGLSRFQRDEFIVAQDKSYVQERTVERRVVNLAQIAELSTTAFTFDPSDETLTVVEPWVLQPDGARIEVPAGNVFTRPSAAAQATPGFVGTQTTTIEFPSLQMGSVVHSKWRHTATKPDVMGFSPTFSMGLTGSMRLEVQIRAPTDLPLQFRERGGFATSDRVEGGTRTIYAYIEVGHAARPEPQMVSPDDVGPAFVATTSP